MLKMVFAGTQAECVQRLRREARALQRSGVSGSSLDPSFLLSLSCEIDAMVVAIGEGIVIDLHSYVDRDGRNLSLRVAKVPLERLTSTKGLDEGRIE